MLTETLFEDDEVLVLHRAGASDFTLVTFAAVGHVPNGTWFWAEAPARKLGLETIGFIAKRRNWYPATSIARAAMRVRPALKRRALGYGYSMGGYAVLKHGAALGLTHGLAIAPQMSIDPADVPGDRRFHHHHDPALHGGMRVARDDAPPIAFAVADPYFPQDALHLDHLVREGAAQPLAMPFHKHAVISRFTSTALLGALLPLVLDGDGPALRAFLRQRRGDSAAAHLWVGRTAQSRGHGPMAEALWRRAVSLGAKPHNIRAVRAVGLQERLFDLLATGQREEARAIADTVILAQPPQARRLVTLARVLLRHGLPGKARLALTQACRVQPRQAEPHLALIDLLRSHGSAEAVAAARQRAEQDLAGDAVALARVAALVATAPPVANGVPDVVGLIAAAAKGDWVGTLTKARAMPPTMATPRAVNAVVNAALMDASPASAAFAARFVAGATLPDRIRVIHAFRFEQASFHDAAFAILDAAPHLYDGHAEQDHFVRGQVANLLTRASSRGGGDRLSSAAQQRLEALLAPAPQAPRAAGVVFGPQGDRLDLSGAGVPVHLASGAPEHLGMAARASIAGFIAATRRAGPPEMTVLEEVFVDRNGIIWDRDGRVVVAHGDPAAPAPPAAMASAEEIPEAVLAIERFNNIYHWFAEWMPSLAWRLNDAQGSAPLLLSDRAAPFMAESIALGAVAAAPIRPVGDAVFVRKLWLGSRAPVRLIHQASYGGLMARIGARAEEAAGPAIGGAPLYLSRRDSTKRRMGNEAELEAALAARGFACLTFSGRPLAEQIALIRRAPMIVAPHGAGLGLLLLARPGARVLEIVPAAPGAMDLRTCFAKMSLVSGLRHEIWLEPSNPFTGQWQTDIPGLLQVLQALEPALMSA